MSLFDQYYDDACPDFSPPLKQKLQDASYYMRSIVKRLYNEESPIDLAMLESEIDSLCDILDIPIGEGFLQIIPKKI